MKYVYYVKNITTGLKYIGVRYSKNCHPDTFWVKYFTSSKAIKLLRDIYGDDDFEYKILKVFDAAYDALLYERKLLECAVKREDYLNFHTNYVESSEEDFVRNQKKQKQVASIVGKLTVIKKMGFHGWSQEQKVEVASKGGYAAAKVNKIRNTGIFDPDVRKKQHETLKRLQVSAYYDPELRKEISSKGGKNGLFSKSYAERNGISEEEMRKMQSERGKKGGSNNKGFKWYNDGVNSFKYTKKQQSELPFDDFLKNNKLNKGRI